MPCVMLDVLGSGAKNGESGGVSETAEVEGSVYCELALNTEDQTECLKLGAGAEHGESDGVSETSEVERGYSESVFNM